MNTVLAVSTTDENARAATGSRRRSVFRRGEIALAHTVYGLILTLATVGELIHHEESAGASVAWLLGAGAVLLAAHLFSDVLAHLASTLDDARLVRDAPGRSPGRVGHHRLRRRRLVMAIAALAGLDAQAALYTCFVVGLVAVAALSFYATSNHRLVTRVLMSFAAVVLGAVIVFGENTF